MRRAIAIGAAAAICLALAAPAAAKPKPSYKVEMTFTESRTWTYHYEQTSPDCTRTDDGNGSEDVTFKGKALMTLERGGRGVAGFSVKGTDARVGARTHTVAGPECAASAVFPSTWSKIAEAAGTVTYAEPNTGCGPKKTGVSFPTLELKRKNLAYEWDSNAAVPNFGECPNFEGSNEAQPGQELPSSQWPDITAKVDRQALLKGKRKVTATGTVEISRIETCANLVQGCPEGVSYSATGSMKADAKFVFTPKKR